MKKNIRQKDRLKHNRLIANESEIKHNQTRYRQPDTLKKMDFSWSNGYAKHKRYLKKRCSKRSRLLYKRNLDMIDVDMRKQAIYWSDWIN